MQLPKGSSLSPNPPPSPYTPILSSALHRETEYQAVDAFMHHTLWPVRFENDFAALHWQLLAKQNDDEESNCGDNRN